jgi:single-strand DNA-binding protein
MKNLTNRVQLIGNLGADPELLSFDTGSLAKFRLATNEYYTNKQGEKVTETTWHNLVAWGPQAERMAAMFQKGMQVLVTGRLRNRSYENKAGEKRTVTEVVVNDFYRISRSELATASEKQPLPAEPLPF